MRVRHLFTTLLVAGTLALSACGQDSPGTGSPPAGGSGDDGGTSATADLSFTGTTVTGETFDGASLSGKPAVLWFWAAWCPICAGQAPDVKGVATTNGDDVSVIGVSGLDTLDAMKDFVDRTGTTGITHIADESGDVWKHFGITEQSTFVLIDASGAIVHSGAMDSTDLDGKVAGMAGTG